MMRKADNVLTAFCSTRVPLWGDLSFYIDGNGKITRDGGTYDAPTPNAFSLPHIATCPGSTPACRKACYVHGLEKNAGEIYRQYRENEHTLHRVLLSYSRMQLAAGLLGGWIARHCTSFRWHVSGDVMHERHARWIVDVCRSASWVDFWIYTRTHELAPILCDAPNLVVNLSADRDNYTQAREVGERLGLRVCYMTSSTEAPPADLPEGSVIFPDYAARGRNLAQPTDAAWWQARTPSERRMVCPPDFFGQSKHLRCGPCTKCLRHPATAAEGKSDG